eukprot:887593-Amphidinium_carterae.1
MLALIGKAFVNVEEWHVHQGVGPDFAGLPFDSTFDDYSVPGGTGLSIVQDHICTKAPCHDPHSQIPKEA